MTKDDIQTIIDELYEASLEEGTELGEYWRGLCNFWKVVHYSNDGVFVSDIATEIRSQHKWFKDNFTWVEHEEIKCECCGKGRPAYRELVFNDDNWG